MWSVMIFGHLSICWELILHCDEMKRWKILEGNQPLVSGLYFAFVGGRGIVLEW